MDTEQAQATAEQQPQSMEDKLAALMGEGGDDNEQAAEASGGEQAEDGTGEQPQDADSAQPQTALETVELDGETYQVPPKLAKAVMQERDYTQGKQAIAQERQLIASQKEAVEAERVWLQQAVPDIAKVQALNDQIEQYERLDWSNLSTDDMIRYKHAADQLRSQRDKLKDQVQTKYQHHQAKVKEAQEKFLDQANGYLAQRISGWSAETARNIMDYGAAKHGFSQAELLQNPKVMTALHKAMLFDKLQTSKDSARNKIAAAPPIIKPGASNPQAQQASDKAAYRKAINSAKTPSQRNEAILSRLERMI